MKILYNPLEPKGAEIHDIMYRDENCFSRDAGEEWPAGTVRKFEDDLQADFIAKLFEFLEEISPEKAQKLIEDAKNQFKCKEVGCGFTTNLKIKLMDHAREHNRTKIIDSLGVPTVRVHKKSDEESEAVREKRFEEENRNQGLDVGNGLEPDTAPGAIMS